MAGRARFTPEDRFWAKVREAAPDDISPNGYTGCWLWTASTLKARGGYGQFSVGRKKYRAHRFAYELVVGPIPANRQLDHLCRRPACVNPAHLEPVTHRENAIRGRGGEHERVKTHCPRGHEYTAANTLLRGPRRTWRTCRQCKRDREVR